ncbi:hypothetical protein GT711_28390 [Clostridium beijerinckii]|uniref:hypothetical protein n=3 Tax=Clostridium beijerinckii TaxID=1520 RepID=UPI00136AA362|nr:hypothetical protein [Clostridium beijerinckii]MZK54169.1 hypothetical protein [Clostridium beijerinckii]MZK87432.1 hypothetical protein [Clostridium beijerinckii]
MAHWCDTWPHIIIASVILKDNKIKLWKVGQNPLRDKYSIEMLIKEHPEYSYEEKKWTVYNDLGHNKVFYEHSKNWFRQWELHPQHLGGSPFTDDGFDFEKIFGGRFEVVKPLKIGD